MNTRLQGAILEEEILDDLKNIDPNTKKTINSGALRGDGDIHTTHFCIDAKDKPRNSSFIATAEEMRESQKQGRKSQLMSAIVVKNRDRKKAVVIPYDDFLSLLMKLKIHRDEHIDY